MKNKEKSKQKTQKMGRTKSSHSGRSNFNYVLKQISKSKKFIILEKKNGIIIKSITMEIPKVQNNTKPNKKCNKKNKNNNEEKQYIFHRDSNKLHELRRWLKRNYQFELLLKH